jgi:hypothetical protein
MRLLAILSAFLFVYLIFQIFKTPPLLRGPGEKLLEMTKDPNLERMLIWHKWCGSLVTVR